MSYSFKDQHQGWSQRIIMLFAKKWKAPQVGYNSTPPNATITSDCKGDFTLLPAKPIASTVSVARDPFAIGASRYTHDNFAKMEDVKFLDRVTGGLVSSELIVAYCIKNNISSDEIHCEENVSGYVELVEELQSLELSEEQEQSKHAEEHTSDQ